MPNWFYLLLELVGKLLDSLCYETLGLPKSSSLLEAKIWWIIFGVQNWYFYSTCGNIFTCGGGPVTCSGGIRAIGAGMCGGGPPYRITGGATDFGTEPFFTLWGANFFARCFFLSSSNFAIFSSTSGGTSSVSGISFLLLNKKICKVGYETGTVWIDHF